MMRNMTFYIFYSKFKNEDLFIKYYTIINEYGCLKPMNSSHQWSHVHTDNSIFNNEEWSKTNFETDKIFIILSSIKKTAKIRYFFPFYDSLKYMV